MKKRNNYNNVPWWVLFVPLPLIVWLALKLAPFVKEGLPGLITQFEQFQDGLKRPFSFVWSADTLKTIAVLCFFYLLLAALWYVNRRKTRDREEHGSAKWANLTRLNKAYAQNETTDRILSSSLRMGLDSWKHQRTLNTMISGGTGAGKTRFVVKPNLLQANTSYVVLDPSGELHRDMGGYLTHKGYRVLAINLKDFLESSHYNPFVYIESEKDVYTLVRNLIKATKDKDEKTNDPFWDNASEALLAALIFLLLEVADPEDQHFGAVVELIEKMEIDENVSKSNHAVDQLFAEREKQSPYSQAVRQYKVFTQAAGKTAKSIVVTLAVRLRHFSLPELVFVTKDDELELATFGLRKTALFIITPVSDTSYNYIVSLLYLQLFQQLYRVGDNLANNSLPVHVQVLMDEFANVTLPPDFKEIQATCRKYNISVHPFVQSLAQLKSLYKDDWEVLEANCDTFIYLGGNDEFTNEHISKRLGKETIDASDQSRSRGAHGSSSLNYKRMGRELMMPNEVGALPGKDCLVLIRGEDPAYDNKYTLESHPAFEEANQMVHATNVSPKHKPVLSAGDDGSFVFTPDDSCWLYSSD